jgi:sialate O-acetylesterase
MKKILSIIFAITMLLSLALLPATTVEAAGVLKLAPVFSNNMVLQRGEELVVYGTGYGSGTVTVDGTTKNITDAKGEWKLTFDGMKATTTPIEFSYNFGGREVVLTNVLVGDVFLTSGQSNMEFTLKSTEQKDSAAKDNSILRFTKGNGGWKEFTKENVQDLSAISVLFAQEIDKALSKDIPIGIISASVGASRVDDWTSMEYCACDKYCQNPHSDYTVYDKGHHDLYKDYIEPVTDFPIAGVLWYQGESNRGIGEALYYYDAFENMVNCWREAWGDENLPFYTVQIMLYGTDGGKDKNGNESDEYNIRIAQGEAARKIHNVTMCSMLSLEDTVRPDGVLDIHPTDKAPVAKALANAALTTYYNPRGEYGKKPEYCGPLYDKITVDKDVATVTFSHIGEGLMLTEGDTVTEFEVCDTTGRWFPVVGTLEGNTVKLTMPGGTQIAGVRMGYHNRPIINLYSKINGKKGYCASPFVWTTTFDDLEHTPVSEWSANGETHWKKCSVAGCSERFEEQLHSGDPQLNCNQRSACTVCQYPSYGANHTGKTELRNKVKATKTEDGYTGDLYCTDCNRIAELGKVIPKGTSDFPLIPIIIAAVSVLVLAAAVVTVIIIVRKKKPKV